MKLRTRCILTLACVILFFILAPAITLYTFGYRYDFNDKKIIQTGVLYLTPLPQDNIKIFINNEEVKKNLSIKGFFAKEYIVYNLMPQTYKISVKKDNFWVWEKNLNILPGKTTYANPLLLSQNPAADLIFKKENINNWSLSPDYKIIAYLIEKESKPILAVYNINSQKNTEIELLNIVPDEIKPELTGKNYSDAKKSIIWSPNSEKIALIIKTNSTRIILFNIQTNSYLTSIISSTPMEHAEWNPKNNTLFYANQEQKISLLSEINSPELSKEIIKNVSGFGINNTILYFIDSNNYLVYSSNPDSPETKKQISFEPLKIPGAKTENCTSPEKKWNKFIFSKNGNIAIITCNKDLFLLKQNGLPDLIDSNIESAEFAINKNVLLYNSQFEISYYSLAGNTKNLITRVGQKINNTAWYKDFAHVWFFSGNVLKNIELDTRPVPNIFDYVSFSASPEQITYDNAAGYIYYGQTENNTLSIFRLSQE